LVRLTTQNKTPFPIRLQMAIDSSVKQTSAMLESRKVILQRLSAGWYEGREMATSRPINIVWRYYNIMMAFLASRTPKSFVRPIANPKFSGFAATLELALNHLKKEMDYRNTLREVVHNSLSYMGMVKTGICHSHNVMIGDTEKERGQPYCDSIDADDIVFDVGARRVKNVQFIGHRYRLPLEYVTTSGFFKNYDKLKPDANLYGSPTAPETVTKENVSSQEYNDIKEHVVLYDLYLPDEGIMVTLPQKGHGETFLRTTDEFPEKGPFDILTYNMFPSSIVPIPPAYSILDLDEQLNVLARRMKRRSEREKTILAYDGAAVNDAERVVGSSDGEAVNVDNIDRLKEIKFGGVDSANMIYADWLEKNVSEQGGNINTLGGLKPQAKTLGQEQILSSHSQGPILDMLNEVEAFCSRVENKLAWYLLSDPTINIPLIKEVSGFAPIETSYSEYVKEGDFLDYNFDIVPYSTQGMSPEAAWQKLMMAISQVVLPTLQMGAEQGQVLDVRKLTELTARYLDTPELVNIYKDTAPQKAEPGPYQPAVGQTKPKSGQPDGRISSGGFNEMSNLNEQQARTGGGAA